MLPSAMRIPGITWGEVTQAGPRREDSPTLGPAGSGRPNAQAGWHLPSAMRIPGIVWVDRQAPGIPSGFDAGNPHHQRKSLRPPDGRAHEPRSVPRSSSV
jgi:hypothetical protein